jgi:hypothetical protein
MQGVSALGTDRDSTATREPNLQAICGPEPISFSPFLRGFFERFFGHLFGYLFELHHRENLAQTMSSKYTARSFLASLKS